VYTTELRNEGSLLVFTGSGVLTAPEIIDATRKLVKCGNDIRDVRLTLVLFDQVTKVEVSADDVRRLSEVDKRLMRLIPRTAIAIVAPKDELFGLSRMWEMLVGIPGWETRVFRTAAEAETWLRAAGHPSQPSQ